MHGPVLLLVDEDRAVLDALRGDLDRRFGVDYRLLAEASPASALASLEELAAASQPVAVVFAGQRMTQMSGVDFLVAAHGVHPTARRVLLVARGDYTAANPAVQAMTLGQVDYHLFVPWQPAERWLYPPVSEFLAGWSKTQPPSFVAIRIVGRQWEARSHALRDMLTRVAMPYRFYAHDSSTGRQLLRESGQDGGRLPVVIFRVPGDQPARRLRRRRRAPSLRQAGRLGRRRRRHRRPARPRLPRRPGQPPVKQTGRVAAMCGSAPPP